MDDTIRNYIEKVVEVQSASDARLQEAELRELAQELGLSEAALDAIDREIENDVMRAENFMRHQLWSDAIQYWEEALALAPNRVEFMVPLMECLDRSGDSEDIEKAERLAREIVELDPTIEPAYALMKRSSQELSPQPRDRFEWVGAFSFTMIGTLVVMGYGLASAHYPLMIAGGLAAFALAIATYLKTKSTLRETVADFEAQKKFTTETNTEIALPPQRLAVTYDIPDGYTIVEHRNTPTSYVKWSGTVTLSAQHDIVSLLGSATFELPSGVKKTELLEVLTDPIDGLHRAGDQTTFIVSSDHRSASSLHIQLEAYGAKEAVPVEWFDVESSGIDDSVHPEDFVFRRRVEGDVVDVLAIRNNGTRYVLKMALRIFSGETTQRNVYYIGPNTTACETFVSTERVDDVRVEIVNIEYEENV